MQLNTPPPTSPHFKSLLLLRTRSPRLSSTDHAVLVNSHSSIVYAFSSAKRWMLGEQQTTKHLSPAAHCKILKTSMKLHNFDSIFTKRVQLACLGEPRVMHVIGQCDQVKSRVDESLCLFMKRRVRRKLCQSFRITFKLHSGSLRPTQKSLWHSLEPRPITATTTSSSFFCHSGIFK